MSRVFQSSLLYVDCNLRSGIDRRRLDGLRRVLELLARPDFPISAIADFSGFPSERVLQKHFRARFHTSMRDWRKARQG